MSVHDRVNTLNTMILQGQILDAFDQFYADDVVMQENTSEPRTGKATNRAYEEAFVNGLTAFHGAEVKALAVNEDDGVSMVQWWMSFSHKDYGDVDRHQVSVQHWKDGRIVEDHQGPLASLGLAPGERVDQGLVGGMKDLVAEVDGILEGHGDALEDHIRLPLCSGSRAGKFMCGPGRDGSEELFFRQGTRQLLRTSSPRTGL